MAEACLNAVKTAKEMNVTVSCDLNYRKKLWSTEGQKGHDGIDGIC